MKEIIKKYLSYIIINLSIILIFTILTVIPTNYDIIVPARTYPISKIYEVDSSYKEDDINIYSVSVLEYYNISVLSYLVSFINPYDILSIHNEMINTTSSYQASSGTIQKEVSLTNALISAYNCVEKSDVHITYEFKGYIIHSVYGDANNYFYPGDIVLKINDNVLTSTNSPNDYITSLKPTDTYIFEILRDNEVKTLYVNPILYKNNQTEIYIIGISMYQYYIIDNDISKTYPSYNITNSSNSYGPSAGLMQSLYLYEALSNEGLTKNIKVVGTGTVSINGTAGAIGGVEQKIIAASLADADIFFVPSSNYDEAKIVYDTLNTKMKLVSVNSLSDCINYLRNFEE